ncbi:MAG TPA: dihydroxyacetone kinase subunit DhaK [Aggregatilineales bacterium]|nr:dihydroxyacetone kinase subunit DhaK [Chloroflexota bacterium]HOA24433.1 dihydroxyacetone kinase subunit DhaK [Aggregatilineales bacterium]HPV06235.1 dihydroxyacetone kinase subunit DhaK [Aggregatilineales bacterium]HQA66877.1 dihydroxyacetone kinase subunit DhaK [Aggregatilineales bacterium]HQE17470.1 dihydroxyacetone kinase subunit DhaK [Aggregatilineales bacterium]
MKKILNNPEEFVADMLDGLYKAHPDQVTYVDDIHSLVRADAPVEGKVGLMTGGGSGHLPVFLGYVGKGMLDGCAIGDVFQSPSVEQIANVTKRINSGKGVVYIYGNYGGDVMNFDMAAEVVAMDDIETRTVLVRDDVASAPPEEADRRRGVAGMVFAFKIAGAKADKGASIDEVVEVTERALANIRTIGVGLSPVTLPAVGTPTFTIGEDEMEIGMGIHGEPGMKREKLQTADEIAERMTNAILDDLQPQEGDRFAVMVNGLGATPLEELYIMYGKVHEILTERGLQIYRPYIGEFATSMEMAGASLTLFRLADDELVELLDAPAHTPFFKQFDYRK